MVTERVHAERAGASFVSTGAGVRLARDRRL